jgi:hypothetical protein
VPVGVVMAAVTCTTPGTVPAVNVVVAPDALESVPIPSGVAVHSAAVGVTLPNASRPTARRMTLAPVKSVEADGSIRSPTGAAPPTVSCCVPAATPAADAVRVTVPAVGSW